MGSEHRYSRGEAGEKIPVPDNLGKQCGVPDRALNKAVRIREEHQASKTGCQRWDNLAQLSKADKAEQAEQCRGAKVQIVFARIRVNVCVQAKIVEIRYKI